MAFLCVPNVDDPELQQRFRDYFASIGGDPSELDFSPQPFPFMRYKCELCDVRGIFQKGQSEGRVCWCCERDDNIVAD